MSKSGKKWLLWISVIILILSIAAIIILNVVPYSDTIDNLQILSAVFISFSLIDLVVMFSIRFQDHKWFNRTMLVSTILVLPSCLGMYFFVGKVDHYPEYILLILVILICLLALFTSIYIFIIRYPDELKGILALLLLIIICVVWSRLKFSFSIVEDLLLPGFIVLTAAGIYMLGVRCLFIIERNRYLKVISYIACTLTAFGCFVFMLKMQGDEFSIMELIYFIPAFLLTMIVLLSLPVSGYVTWTSLQKRILKKIAIAWVFFLIIFSVRYIYPDLFNSMIFRQKPEPSEFWFQDYDYKIPDNNGLEIH
jgi:hypothetical protein